MWTETRAPSAGVRKVHSPPAMVLLELENSIMAFRDQSNLSEVEDIHTLSGSTSGLFLPFFSTTTGILRTGLLAWVEADSDSHFLTTRGVWSSFVVIVGHAIA